MSQTPIPLLWIWAFSLGCTPVAEPQPVPSDTEELPPAPDSGGEIDPQTACDSEPLSVIAGCEELLYAERCPAAALGGTPAFPGDPEFYPFVEGDPFFVSTIELPTFWVFFATSSKKLAQVSLHVQLVETGETLQPYSPQSEEGLLGLYSADDASCWALGGTLWSPAWDTDVCALNGTWVTLSWTITEIETPFRVATGSINLIFTLSPEKVQHCEEYGF